MRRPEYLLGQSPESAVIDPENLYVLAGHLGCAAAEMPIRADDVRYFGPQTLRVAQALVEEEYLRETSGAFYWAQPQHPSHRVGLRTVSDDTYTIVETTGGNQVIGQVDAISAPELVYPEAIYLHEGQTHVVERLDPVGKVAYVRREDTDYYTQPILESLIQIKGMDRERAWGKSVVRYGEVDVTWATVAFKKVQFYTTDSLGWAKVDWPAQTLATAGVWLTPSSSSMQQVRETGRNPTDGLVGIRNAAVHLLPLYAMCDKADVGGMIDSMNLGSPTLFLYDRYRGGLGFAETAYDRLAELFNACLGLIRECDCEEGCPSCVGVPILRPAIHQDPDAGGGFPTPDKAAASAMLVALLTEAGVLSPS
jgi:DEAD/DEAH box helicase domain-containing protein